MTPAAQKVLDDALKLPPEKRLLLLEALLHSLKDRNPPKDCFMQAALAGKFSDLEEALEDAVEQWHKGTGGCALHEFLGLTHQEYALWIEDPTRLPGIVDCRRNSLPTKAEGAEAPVEKNEQDT